MPRGRKSKIRKNPLRDNICIYCIHAEGLELDYNKSYNFFCQKLKERRYSITPCLLFTPMSCKNCANRVSLKVREVERIGSYLAFKFKVECELEGKFKETLYRSMKFKYPIPYCSLWRRTD